MVMIFIGFIGTIRQADGPDSRGLRTTDLHDPLTGILSGSAPDAQSSEQEALQQLYLIIYFFYVTLFTLF